MTTFLLIVIAVIAYLLGGVNGAIIASKYIFKRDIRNYGSGNAGLTNFYRTFGAPGTALVLAIDIMKAVLSVLLGGLLLGIVKEPMVGKLFAGFCCMMGHAFPVYYGLRGGKGVLCGGIVILMTDWRVGLVCWAVFAIVVILTRYVSLASIVCSLFFPIGIWIAKHGGLEGTLGMFSCLLLIFKHRDNIGRLISGKESRIDLTFKSKKRFEE